VAERRYPLNVPTKTIVVCCDGTGLSYVGPTSNVLRIFQLAVKAPGVQIACYDPGVGTLPSRARTPASRWLRRGAELWLGWGVIENVIELYAYLMRHYEPGDEIFLFGFSRGAFVVRALAGMIHVCGLLDRDDGHLLKYASGLYQTSERRIVATRKSAGYPVRVRSENRADHAKFDLDACRFKTQLSRPCTIAFMGLWDTVKAYGWFWPQSFPALRHNPSVRRVRHAVSLHERRSSFQLTGWGDNGPDVKEIWFRGDHSDVGGGHPGMVDCPAGATPEGSPLSDATLGWMLGEATHAGLLIDRDRESAVASLVEHGRSAMTCEPHDLLHGWFRLAEIAPRFELDNSTYPPCRSPRFWPTGRRRPGDHVDVGEPRYHETVPPPEAKRFTEQFAQHPDSTLPAILYDGTVPQTDVFRHTV
jgi:uncharacterized protein (DUF2235 family)